jgi:glutathione synthase/RimK-type ligase-like ATP-grasp enzyme
MTKRRKIAIIGGSIGEIPIEQSEYVAAFNEYFSTENDISALDITKFIFDIDDDQFAIFTNNGESLDQFDAILCRGRLRSHTEILYAISRYAHLNRMPIANDYSNYYNQSKLSQTVMMYEAKLPFIRTIFSVDKTNLKQYVADHVSTAIVAKSNHGAHGDDNYLLKNAGELGVIDQNDKQYIVQPFVPNDSDYRILVMGDTEPTIIKRSASAETHLNNTSKGASVQLAADLPKEIIADAKMFARTAGLAIAGVDAMYDQGAKRYVFLEINSQPQILTGAYTDRKKAQLQLFINELH